jgi:ABC-type lipoprotein release transport system permease subunit
MVFFLAFRNITRNKKDSAVIALLIAVITFLFFIGNSVIGRVDSSLRRAYIESLTGDVVLEKSGDVTMNLFGANAPVIDEFFTIPVFPAYNAVMGIVSAETGVSGITSQVSGKAYMDVLGVREPALLYGVDTG